MKKSKLLRNAFVIALTIWIVMLIKQQINITQYKDEINVLEIPEIYKEITYEEYLNLLNNKEEAIVVVGRDTCYFCVLYKK